MAMEFSAVCVGKLQVKLLLLLVALAPLAYGGSHKSVVTPPPQTGLVCNADDPNIANINELGDVDSDSFFDYIEVKILQDSTDIDGWKLCAARDGKDPTCALLGQGGGHWSDGSATGTDDDNGSGGTAFLAHTGITYSDDDIKGLRASATRGEVILVDSRGLVIDHIGYSRNSSCTTQDYWDMDASCGTCLTLDASSSNKMLVRKNPDGEGDWVDTGDTPTPGSTNNTVAVAGVDHYQLSYDSSPGITCQATTVTATAHDGSDPDAVFIPTNGLELTFSSTAGCVFTPSVATFDGSSSQVTTQMSCPSIGPAEIAVSDTNGIQDAAAEDPGINFVEAKFEFYNLSSSTNALPAQISGKRSDQSPGNTSLQLRAIVTDPNTGVCVARIQSAPVDVQMDFQCIDPGSCVAGQELRVENRLGIEQLLPGTISLDFDPDGRAEIPFIYTDAGRILIQASATLAEAPPLPAVTLSGVSNDFVVKPAGLCVDVVEAAAECAAVDGSCSVFRQAGAPFALSIRGVGWEGRGEANTDFCSGNSTTPNYRDAAIGLTSGWAATESGVAGVLAVDSAAIVADGVVSIANQSVSEVGVFEFTATPGNYLGEVLAASTSAAVGRFTPAYFTLSTGMLNNRSELVCTDSFNYLGEVFQASFILNGWNLDELPVLNYGGSFAKFTSYSQLGLGAVDLSGSGLDLSSRLIDQAGLVFSLSSGEVSVVVPLILERAAGVDGPFESVAIGTQASDLDGIGLRVADYDLDTDLDLSNDRIQIGLPTTFYFGRLRLENAFGPETEPLRVVAQTEYFNGIDFLPNLLDSCSPLALDIIDPALGRVASGATISVGTGTSTLQLSSPVDLGDLALAFGAPGVGSSGEIRFQFSDSGSPAGSGIGSLPWLLFDWDSDGAFDDDPGARKASFGRYRGHDNVIHWQENFSR